MGFFKKIFRKKSDYKPEITDEMREKGLQIRQENARIRQLELQMAQRERLAKLEQAITGGGSSSKAEDMIMQLFMQAMVPQSSGTITPQNSVRPSTARDSIGVTDPNKNDQIAQLIKSKVPEQYLQVLGTLSDSDILDIKNRVVGQYVQQ